VIRRRISAVVVATLVGGLLAGCSSGSGDQLTVTAEFDSAVGIYETGAVLVLDQEVGTIEDVELRDDVVRITMSVRDDVPLPADVTATIQATSVLGERSIALFPSWSAELEAAGAPKLADGDNIPRDRTQEPVEPDQALQAFNELLAGLDPDAVGGLVTDGATILDGRGERINTSIGAVAELSDTLAAVDGPLLDTASSLNRIAGVLNQRDAQLRALIDDFGAAVGTLADERTQIESLLGTLVDLTGQTEYILDAHAERLPATIATLAATVGVVEANTSTLTVLTDTLPDVVESFEAAYKPELGGFYLNVNTLAVVQTVVEQLLDAVGLFPGEI
jgi:phospholipid/cholesterol/gamma-HCH transport system substrate-binding protein